MHEGKTWRIGMAGYTTLSATWTYINTTFCWLASVTSLEICHVVWTCPTSKFCTEKVQKLESGVAFGIVWLSGCFSMSSRLGETGETLCGLRAGKIQHVQPPAPNTYRSHGRSHDQVNQDHGNSHGRSAQQTGSYLMVTRDMYALYSLVLHPVRKSETHWKDMEKMKKITSFYRSLQASRPTIS